MSVTRWESAWGSTARPSRRAWLAAVAAAGMAGGCNFRGGGPPRVLTSLAEPVVAPWLAMVGLDPAEVVRPLPGPDPWLAVERGERADLVLGGPWWTYAARLGEPADTAGWTAWGPATLGLWVDELGARHLSGGVGPGANASDFWALASDPDLAGRLAWSDPRTDGALLTAAVRHLARGWPGGYSDLVRWAAVAQPVSEPPLSPGGRLGRPAAVWGDANSPPSLGASVSRDFTFVPCPEGGSWIQGAAVLPGARDAAALRAALPALPDRASAAVLLGSELTARADLARSPLGLTLLSELMHATLAAAQPELQQAWETLRAGRTGEIERAWHWVGQPPPWPPASVELLKTRPRSDRLLAELAGQVCTTSASRDTLRAEFEGEAGLLDGDVLLRLAESDSGRLATEPRFRTWIRAEWLAWARQRYRRTARLAEGKAGPA